MSLLEQVNILITNILTNDLAEFVADHFGLESDQVSIIIKDYLNHVATPVKNSTSITQQNSGPAIKAAASKINKCSFIITRGPKEGTVCGTSIRGGGEYCSKHK